MLRAIFADAVFCAALFVESLALLSILKAQWDLQLPEELVPIMSSYQEKAAPLSSIAASLFAGRPPPWYVDAMLIAAVLFFLFCIRQLRNGMAPYGDDPYLSRYEDTTRAELAIDFFLPVAVCALGALATAPTLLPFLTVPVALWLILKRLLGKPSWFQVSASYYVNLVLLAAVAVAIQALAR